MLVFISFYINGQTTTSITAGGDATGSNGRLSYSVGQVIYLPVYDVSNNSVTGGVQQAFEISDVSALTNDVQMRLSVYPNPSTHFLNVDFGEEETHKLKIELFDSNGKILQQKQELSKITTINLDVYVRGIYYLHILKNDQVLKTFKIIKK